MQNTTENKQLTTSSRLTITEGKEPAAMAKNEGKKRHQHLDLKDLQISQFS